MSTNHDALTPLGPGKEFDRIRSILKDLPRGEGVRLGPGDDGAILAEGIVLSTDLSVEGVHFRLDWITAEEAGWRAAAAALSDLAAMGATPAGILASVAVPGEGELALALMEGVRGAAAAVGAPLLGGDLTRSPGPILIDLTVVGRVQNPLLRRGARTGDGVWVTGSLGWAGAAVQAWMAGQAPTPESRGAFLRPVPRIQEAQWLVEVAGATAGMDLSDGLAGDAGHLASASGVGIMLWSRALEGLAPPGPGGVDLALRAGEDYELLVTLPPDFSPERVDQFREKFDLTLTRVGKVVEEPGVWLLPASGGAAAPVPRGGWDAFRDATEPMP
jgi:thiamine-monophosphate kinase